MPRGVRATGYGAAGGRRDTAARSAKQRTRRERRSHDPRIRAAQEEVDAAYAELDKLNAELENSGPAVGAMYPQKKRELEAANAKVQEKWEALTDVEKVVPIKKVLPKEGNGGKGWALGQARTMLMHGYTLEHVVETTGFGTKHFEDIPLKDGRGVSREEWLEALEKKDRRTQIESQRLM
jgi:DNA repair exonuclease SbcCD ATPase subunit